jgi:hypothetical protein
MTFEEKIIAIGCCSIILSIAIIFALFYARIGML